MTFDTEVVKPGRGRAIRVDISLNRFATIAYRYSDVAGVLDGTNQYTPRVLDLGGVRRAFGNNRLASSSTTSLSLANADGGVDWLCGRANIADAARARFRIYVALYDPSASPLTFTAKMLGEFVLSAWPSRDNEAVSLALADDFMGLLGAGLLLPTLLDWQAVGNASNNPIYNSLNGLNQAVGVNTPIQLAFGEDTVLAMPHIIPQDNNGSGDAYENKIVVPLYCTLDATAVSQTIIHSVEFEAFRVPPRLDSVEDPDPVVMRLERSVADYPVTNPPVTVWAVEKSPAISKGGLSFYVVYLVVRSDLGNFQLKYAAVTTSAAADSFNQRVVQLTALKYSGGYEETAVDSMGFPAVGSDAGYAAFGSRVTKWYVRGTPLSQITNPTAYGVNFTSHSVDVLTDLVSEYSTATVDATSAARVRAALPNAAVFGVVQPWTERANNMEIPPPPMSLRQVLSELAQSSDLDIFVDWDGEIAFSADVWDFTTATQASTLLEIREEELDRVESWVPSDGERGAPFNRVYFEGGRGKPSEGVEVPFQGPYDLAAADIPTSVRSIEVGLRQGWRPYRQTRQDPWQWRGVDGVTRDRVRFVTGISGLRLELGMCFKLTWTRGTIGGPYSATVFQCEAITYAPGDDTVQVEGIWRDDTQTERQYLLDDETLLVRGKGALTGSATTGTGDDVVTFGGTINLTTMGVTGGDILILRDSSEAADAFVRNRCLRIDTKDSDTQVTCVQQVVTGGVVINADWSIVRGAQTYPTAVSDPTNYPSGGSMYGKATASNGTTSDAATGNRLIMG